MQDTAGYPVSGAVVAILDEQALVIHFALSDQNGRFEIKNSTRGYWIDAGLLGYTKVRRRLQPSDSSHHFRLVPETKMMAEVVVKQRPPTELLGDTLKYYVRNFATKDDRTIGDVIRRLPGVEVGRDGTIYFNGRKIENLYIEGDDLMDGRYGTAVKVIKKELIESVDIIRNHQPIAVMKDKVFTDHVALNLVLKDSNSMKLSASSQIGAGHPDMVEASFAPILLNRKIKSVNRIAYNTSGIDYRAELQQLGGSNFADNIRSVTKDLSLSFAGPSPPDVPASYYYFNQSAMVNSNTIYKNKSGTQFKVNGAWYRDRSKLTYGSQTFTYLANDTIRFLEKQRVIGEPEVFHLGFNVMINKPTHFLSNTLRTSFTREAFFGDLSFNSNSFSQQLNQKFSDYTNDFTWMPALKRKGILEFRWLLAQRNGRQDLNIGKGYYFDIAPQQGSYDQAVQAVESPTFSQHAYFSYKLPSRHITQEYRIGFRSGRQGLFSHLSLVNSNVSLPYANDSGNEMTLRDNNLYFLGRYQIRFEKFRTEIVLPLHLQQVNVLQKRYAFDENRRQLLLQPEINLTYNFTNEKYVRASYQLSNEFTNLTSLYRGAILLSFRSLLTNEQGLQMQRSQRISLMYSHQKSIKLFFFNAGISYRKTTLPSIQADSFTNNIRRTISLLFSNEQRAVAIHASVSQYVFPIKTKLGLKIQWQHAESLQLLNRDLLTLQSRGLNASYSADKRFAGWLDFHHEAEFSWNRVQLFDGNKTDLTETNVFLGGQQFKLTATIPWKLQVEVSGSHRLNQFSGSNRSAFFFADASLKRPGLFRGLDVELNCANLFNETEYGIFMQQANQVFISRYPLRGRTVLLRASYIF